MSNFLNVVNGSITLHALQQAGIPGEMSEYADVLHEGPVPPDNDVDEWLDTRAAFIAACGWESLRQARERMRTWQHALESFRDYDDVILWYEHDLFDQLLLIRHLNWWWRHAPVDPPSLVSPADYLGSMAPAKLVAYFEARERVSEAQLTLAASAWQAFTAPQPTELVRIIQHENTAPLPHLHAALLRLLEEYPSTFNGVGRTEQQILEILGQSPLNAYDLFTANARREERVFMGDATFFLHLRALLEAPHPLLYHRNSGGLPELTEDTTPIQLTDDGRRVLAGEADNIELNGIDRWIGGLHLTRSAVWRWNGVECVPD